MTRRDAEYDLVRALADGRRRDPGALCREANVAPAVLQEGIRGLETLGVALERLPAGGYRLARPVELLDAARIRAYLDPDIAECMTGIDVRLTTDSTNQRLLEAGAPPPGRLGVCLAELQHAGRGRLGRRWVSPFGTGLCLSLSCRLQSDSGNAASLSLAAGVAVRDALEACGVTGTALKWPNDIVWRSRKLAGLLCEMRTEAVGSTWVVVGVGINVALDKEALRQFEGELGRALVATSEIRGGRPPGRNRLAGEVISSLVEALKLYETRGFSPFHERWLAADGLNGRAVTIRERHDALTGVAMGVDDSGALLVNISGETRRFTSGEVSLGSI